MKASRKKEQAETEEQMEGFTDTVELTDEALHQADIENAQEVTDADDASATQAETAAAAEPTSDQSASSDERLLRLQADFDNFRKRVLREKEDLYRRANEDLMEELLPVMDHLDLALASVGDRGTEDPVVKGFELVASQLRATLQKFGLESVETAIGADFDPNHQEAIAHMASADIPENGIIAQTRSGYVLGGRLLRASQVVVSSGPAE